MCGKNIPYSLLWEKFSSRKLQEILVEDIYIFWICAILSQVPEYTHKNWIDNSTF